MAPNLDRTQNYTPAGATPGLVGSSDKTEVGVLMEMTFLMGCLLIGVAAFSRR